MNIMRDLEYFKPVQKDGYIEMKMPVAMKIYKSLLTLQISEVEDGYLISDDGDAFYEFNEDSDYYFNLFKEKNCCYGIQLENEKFFKLYKNNFNLNVALNEFVRFFIDLDNFIIKNNIH